MESRKKQEVFCGDTYNYLPKTNNDFHWSNAFGWYLKLTIEEKRFNNLWATGLEKVGFMLEAFSVP